MIYHFPIFCCHVWVFHVRICPAFCYTSLNCFPLLLCLTKTCVPKTFSLPDNTTVIFRIQNAELDILLLNSPLSSPSLLWDRTWLCSRDWPGIHKVEWAWIFLGTVLYFAFRELGLQSLATVTILSHLALLPYGLRSLCVFLKVSISPPPINVFTEFPTSRVYKDGMFLGKQQWKEWLSLLVVLD